MSGRSKPYDASRDALFHPCSRVDAIAWNAMPQHLDVLCAQLACLVYCKFEKDQQVAQAVTQRLQDTGFARVEFFSNGGTQGFCALSPNHNRTVLAFRGTEPDDYADIFTDIDALPARWRGQGQVHQGFAKALEQVWTTVEGLLNGASGKTIFTGHSLGAALATLAAGLRPPAHLCTFGSPRVGNDAFAASLHGVNARRYADCCDVVAQLPPENPTYTHVGALHYLDRFGNVTIGPNRLSVTIDQFLARGDYLRAQAWQSGNVGLRDLADHAPINYVYGLNP